MKEITLTEFVDFAIKSGTPKLTQVRKIKKVRAEDYNPAGDYYKQLRKAIVDMHKSGDPASILDDVLRNGVSPSRRSNYSIMIQSYKKFVGRKNLVWFNPPKKIHWIYSDLDVRVNPELGLVFGAKKTLVKLYFKRDKPSKHQLAVIGQMMFESISNGKYEMALLDVRRGKLHRFDKSNSALLPLLEGEAEALIRMLDTV